jgi:hypothetical protein
MIDDLATLRRPGALYRLLDHYDQQAATDREVYQRYVNVGGTVQHDAYLPASCFGGICDLEDGQGIPVPISIDPFYFIMDAY